MSEATTLQMTSEVPDEAARISQLNEIVKSAELAFATLAEIVESAKAASASISEAQAAITTGGTEAQTKLADISAVATQAMAAKTQITDAQAIIATKSDHIQNAQEHADSIRASLDRALTEATLQVTESEGLKSRAQSATDTATTLLTEIKTTKGSVETDAATVMEFRKSSEESAAQSKGLADRAVNVETRLADYEKRLCEIDVQSADQLEKIENLLRGATSASLAHAFDDRRRTFLKPHILWQSLFIISLAVLVGLAIHGLWAVYQVDRAPEWDELLRMWLSRLPLVGALVWLAMHASREAALAKRLEEDYGYKAAIATCFEGFRKEMTNVGKDVGFDSALGKLCSDTLTTMATPPGRIYDKHALAVTPVDELKQIARAATDAAKSIADSAKPLAEAAAKAAKP